MPGKTEDKAGTLLTIDLFEDKRIKQELVCVI